MKVFVIKKNTLIYAAVAFLLCIGLLVSTISLVPKIAAASAGKRLIPIYNVDRSDKTVSLSFDAAWGNEDTQTLIDILNRYHIKATFFIVGMWVDKYPESVKALSDAGEDVMNHSNKHPHMPQLSSDAMLQEITDCDNKIQKITGKKPILFRPPYGDYNNTLIETLTASGHYCIQWDVDSLDWKGISASQIQERVLSKVKSGSIVLFHNAALHTPEALPGIIESLQKQGYHIVPISQLIYRDHYTIDHAGMQHSETVPSSSPAQNSGSSAGSR